MENHNNILGTDIKDAQDVDGLLRKLRDFSDDVRQNAALSLGGLKDKKALGPLIGRLSNDKSSIVRDAAARALYTLGDIRGWEPIKTALRSDSSPEVRQTAAKILGNLGIKAYARDLVNSLRDENDNVRQDVAKAIGQLKDPEVIPLLIANISDQNYIIALIQMGTMVVDAIFESTKSLKANTSGYSQSVNGYDLEYNLQSFYQDRVSVIGGIGQDILGMISAYCEIRRPIAIRVIATRALGAIDDPRSTQLLCWQAVNDPDPAIRYLALDGTKNRSNDNIADMLIKVLKEEKEWILRRKVAENLGAQKEKKAVKTLSERALQDPHPKVREEIIRSLGLIGDDSALKTLYASIERDNETKMTAIEALGKLKNPDAISILGDLILNFPAPSIRIKAAEALGYIGTSASIEYLLSGIGSDGDSSVRVACAAALGRIGDLASLTQLNYVADGNDPSSDVIRAAKSAIQEINKRTLLQELGDE